MSVEIVKKELIDQLKRHGLPFILMAMAVLFFYDQFNELRREVDECNDQIIELYSKDHNEMIKVISENTQAIRYLTDK